MGWASYDFGLNNMVICRAVAKSFFFFLQNNIRGWTENWGPKLIQCKQLLSLSYVPPDGISATKSLDFISFPLVASHFKCLVIIIMNSVEESWKLHSIYVGCLMTGAVASTSILQY